MAGSTLRTLVVWTKILSQRCGSNSSQSDVRSIGRIQRWKVPCNSSASLAYCRAVYTHHRAFMRRYRKGLGEVPFFHATLAFHLASGYRIPTVIRNVVVVFPELTYHIISSHHKLDYFERKGCSRNYPKGGTFFFRPLHPQDTHGVRAPRPPGHVSALINLPHYGSNTSWPQGQVTYPPPTPRTHCQQNTLHPQDKKVFAAHPPLRIISGTALML